MWRIICGLTFQLFKYFSYSYCIKVDVSLIFDVKNSNAKHQTDFRKRNEADRERRTDEVAKYKVNDIDKIILKVNNKLVTKNANTLSLNHLYSISFYYS